MIRFGDISQDQSQDDKMIRLRHISSQDESQDEQERSWFKAPMIIKGPANGSEWTRNREDDSYDDLCPSSASDAI